MLLENFQTVLESSQGFSNNSRQFQTVFETSREFLEDIGSSRTVQNSFKFLKIAHSSLEQIQLPELTVLIKLNSIVLHVCGSMSWVKFQRDLGISKNDQGVLERPRVFFLFQNTRKRFASSGWFCEIQKVLKHPMRSKKIQAVFRHVMQITYLCHKKWNNSRNQNILNTLAKGHQIPWAKHENILAGKQLDLVG